MKKTAEELLHHITQYTSLLEKVSEEEYRRKPLPEKWCKIEILGHLVDSAQNNLRRFIVTQYEENQLIGYRQDDWVKISAYREYPTADLISLWILLNKHICRVLEQMNPGDESRTCFTGGKEPKMISWIATDYIKHMLHHLHQVLDLEPIPYP